MRKRSFLDEALHQATLKERERVIKLLEEIISERQKVEQTTWVQNEISNLRYLIELIKGETNA